jgi:hypothetical protein
MVNYSFSGGSKMKQALQRIQSKLAGESQVRVGFLENATYPAVDNSIRRVLAGIDKLNSTGPQVSQTLLSAYDAKHAGAPKPSSMLHVATVAWWNNFGTSNSKPRPFFSDMIAEESPAWGSKIANGLRKTDYNSTKTLRLLGIDIADALVKKIVDWPADNAPLTVAIKGFNKGLVDSAVMERNVDYEVIR